MNARPKTFIFVTGGVLSGLGKVGLPNLADLCLQKTHYLEENITALPGVKRAFSAPFFHEFAVTLPKPAAQVNEALVKRGFIGGAAIDSWAQDVRNPWLLCATERNPKADMDAFVAAVGEVLQ